MKTTLVCCILPLVFAGCEQGGKSIQVVTFEQKELPRLNPTAYDFDATLPQVKKAIRKACGEQWFLSQAGKNHERVWKGGGDTEASRRLTQVLQLPPGSLFFKGDADALTRGLLAQHGNENDAYFYGIDSPIGESQIYFTDDGQPAIYYADFHIHLTALGTNRTRVEIFTYDSTVAIGAEKAWTAHGHEIGLITAKVPPTTVEEYQILLRIGEQLGAKDMPALITPGTNAPMKQVTRPRLS